MNFKKKFNENEGITLIILVITIIVLIILAGISLSALKGNDGIIKRATEAKEKAENEVKEDNKLLNEYELELSEETEKDELPKKLEVGSKVKYSPSGTYNWQGKYCSTSESDVTLSSASGKDFNLTEWKVLSIKNRKVELVPTSPTSGTVYLGEAQGYNNAVKLLNDACSSLYSNTSKGITARSLNLDDIEKYMNEEKLTSAKNDIKYGEQLAPALTSNKAYPTIYAKEKLSVVNGTKKSRRIKYV